MKLSQSLILSISFMGLRDLSQQVAAVAQPTVPVQSTSAAGDNPITTLHVTSHLVLLDMVVIDGNGKPVKGLKPSAVTVTEDGVPQKLFSFTEHDVDEGAGVQAYDLPQNTFTVQAPITEAVTKTVIVLANLGTDQDFVRSDIREFVRKTNPSGPICLVRLDREGMHLVQDFTSDPKVLLEALTSRRIMPPLGFQVVPILRAEGTPAKNLTHYLSGIPGRINLVWIGAGGGEMATKFPDLAEVVRNLNIPAPVLRLSQVALYTIDPQGYIGNLSTDKLTRGNLSGGSLLFANSARISDESDLAEAAGGHAFFNGVKQALSEIVSAGGEYYTLSYVPSNANWDGHFRRIHIEVAGIPEVTKSWANFWSMALGWTEDDERKVLYREGYLARPDTQPKRISVLPKVDPNSFSIDVANKRKLISVSPAGAPRSVHLDSMQTAMSLGALTPDRLKFTIKVNPSLSIEKIKHGALLPKDDFMKDVFRDTKYRNYKIHYWIDPDNLALRPNSTGRYVDDIRIISICYRDDGVEANSIATTIHVDLGEDDLELGVTVEQTLAIPTTGNFFLRAGVQEVATDHIGVLQVPTEWIKVYPASNANATKSTP